MKNIDRRLMTAAEYVRQGAVLADVGCDHALLPVFLLNQGRISRAICADIAKGPLAAAERNLSECGLLDKVSLVRTDGLLGLDDMGITDISICGMGGELISDIIARAPFVKNNNIRLILQPMTRAYDLCKYLCENGFEIMSQRYCEAKGKIYRTLLVSYTGEVFTSDDISMLVGTMPSDVSGDEAKAQSELYRRYKEKQLNGIRKSLEGKRKAGLDCAFEEKILHEAEVRE